MEETNPRNQTNLAIYEVRIQGRLPERFAGWFEEFTIHVEDQETVLRGPARDPSALYGLIDHLRDLNLVLVEIRRCSG